MAISFLTGYSSDSQALGADEQGPGAVYHPGAAAAEKLEAEVSLRGSGRTLPGSKLRGEVKEKRMMACHSMILDIYVSFTLRLDSRKNVSDSFTCCIYLSEELYPGLFSHFTHFPCEKWTMMGYTHIFQESMYAVCIPSSFLFVF